MFGTVLDHLGKFWNIWPSFGELGVGSILESFGAYGRVWESLGEFKKIWERLGAGGLGY